MSYETFEGALGLIQIFYDDENNDDKSQNSNTSITTTIALVKKATAN